MGVSQKPTEFSILSTVILLTSPISVPWFGRPPLEALRCPEDTLLTLTAFRTIQLMDPMDATVSVSTPGITNKAS